MKYERHSAIMNIIESEPIETQEELTLKLRERGFNVTQATVSRDIKELRLVKITSEGGASKYAAFSPSVMQDEPKLMPVFEHAFVSAENANNLIVIKTLAGMAQALASAVDSMDLSGIIGTVAGDDTVLMVCKSERHAEEILAFFRRITAVGGNHA